MTTVASETQHHQRRASQENEQDEQNNINNHNNDMINTALHAIAVAAADPSEQDKMSSSISPTRQKTRDQKVLAERVFFQHCSSTYKAEFAYYNTMTEPAAGALSHLRERETVFRNYVEKDRNLDFGFLSDDFFDGREQIELVEEEAIRRRRIEVDALTFDDNGEPLMDVLGSGVKLAEIKTEIRLCQAQEHADRSKIVWEMQKALKRVAEEGNKEFLIHHHRETLRVNDDKKELFFGVPGATLSNQQQQQQKTASQLVQEELEEERKQTKTSSSSRAIPSAFSSTKFPSSSSASVPVAGIISSSAVPNFPAVPEVDFTFLEESEVQIRDVMERTALQELKSAARALRAFQVDAANDIEIMRLKKKETIARSVIVGYMFRYFLLMIQEQESCVRESSLGISEKQHRTQIDVVENRCWLKAKETQTWRTDRERSFAVAEERKQREQQWQKERLDEENRKHFIRSELQSRVDDSRDEHYARSIIQEQFDREYQFLRKREIASVVESEVSANTLKWTEEFHAQIVVSERQKRRQLVSEEATERNEILSLEVRDYIQTRRDELFDQDTSDAMRHIDKVRERGGELTALSLPAKFSSGNNNNNVLAPRPPPVISYQRGTAGGSRPSSTPAGNNNNGTATTTTTGASLRAPRV